MILSFSKILSKRQWRTIFQLKISQFHFKIFSVQTESFFNSTVYNIYKQTKNSRCPLSRTRTSNKISIKMDNSELDKAMDNHQVKTEERVMRVDGHILTEKKSTTFIEGFYSGRFHVVSKTIVEYVRSIENNFGAKRTIKVIEHSITGKRT